eukprot:CAMPEP_0196662294 /NCGR_PEP_ID=MMETSP1086-20130531/48039_1 /TAXON_ID=77921 /ORGANISM="Cyanoptyche  gloeocystis , Strain SAG4.97" /LENGTH=30 /DNA_ID= /DNA_START= /DNA_END= /DNA_ORIENTATION=
MADVGNLFSDHDFLLVAIKTERQGVRAACA